MSAGSNPKLSISIIHLGGGDLLRNCLASIPNACARTVHEVIVVDNDSHDGSREILRAEFPHVRAIELDYRQGFSANHNLAHAQSHAPFLLLLNNDTILHAGALDQLVGYLEDHSDVGIVGPMVWNPDGTPQASCGPFPSLRSELMANCLPSRWLPRPVVHSRIEVGNVVKMARATTLRDRGSKVARAVEPLRSSILDPQSLMIPDPPEGSWRQSSICGPDWIGGVCLTTRREVWEALGGLDAEFYLFFDETDFCKRAADAGWKVAHILSANVTHLGGQTTGQDWIRNERSLIYVESQLRYFRKHHSPATQLVLRGVSALSFLGRALVWRFIHREALAGVFIRSARLQARGVDALPPRAR